MENNIKQYTVFISYSWTSEKHSTWVRNLAERLINDSVEVRLDQWDLKPGDDKYKFMESMVEDKSIDKVLIICDANYKEKADKRDKGVGVETQIITPDIYSKSYQQKFIPIVVEVGDDFDSFIPNYLKSRIGIDMSSEDKYEEGYEQLLRLIYDKPQYNRPPKGNPPYFLFQDKNTNFKTANINKQLKHFLLNKPNQSEYIMNQFVEELINSLEQFKITYEEFKQPYDQQIYDNIEKMVEIRNDYINFLLLLCKLKKDFDIEIIIKLFEEIYKYTQNQDSGTYIELQFDHYKFFVNEIFLYTVAILIEEQMFEHLNELLSTKYFVKSGYEYIVNGVLFNKFNFYIPSLDEYRKKRLNSNKISLSTQILIDRSKINGKNYRDKIIDADLLLFYIADIKFKQRWFPSTYIYKDDYKKIDLLKKIVRKKYFEKIKVLFNVDTPKEMKELVENQQIMVQGYHYEQLPKLKDFVNVDEIANF